MIDEQVERELRIHLNLLSYRFSTQDIRAVANLLLEEEIIENSCDQCGTFIFEEEFLKNGNYFMVHDELWEEISDNSKGLLCLSCFEKNLGRSVTENDLTDAPVNEEILALLKKRSSWECGCGCEDGPQCEEMNGVYRCVRSLHYDGAHESYGMDKNGGRKYITWQS